LNILLWPSVIVCSMEISQVLDLGSRVTAWVSNGAQSPWWRRSNPWWRKRITRFTFIGFCVCGPYRQDLCIYGDTKFFFDNVMLWLQLILSGQGKYISVVSSRWRIAFWWPCGSRSVCFWSFVTIEWLFLCAVSEHCVLLQMCKECEIIFQLLLSNFFVVVVVSHSWCYALKCIIHHAKLGLELATRGLMLLSIFSLCLGGHLRNSVKIRKYWFLYCC
jgi:hypothetical protein